MLIGTQLVNNAYCYVMRIYVLSTPNILCVKTAKKKAENVER